jgi:DNA repair exonuclease SbcCD ATPase subunit
MTPEQRQELERLRRQQRMSAMFPVDWRRLIELERMDAAEKCPVCEIEHNTQRRIDEGTLPILNLKDAP